MCCAFSYVICMKFIYQKVFFLCALTVLITLIYS